MACDQIVKVLVTIACCLLLALCGISYFIYNVGANTRDMHFTGYVFHLNHSDQKTNTAADVKPDCQSGRRCSNDVRIQRIQEACSTYPMYSPVNMNSTQPYSHILVDDKHEVLYCMIAKVACTTLKTTLVKYTDRVTLRKKYAVHNWKFLSSVGLNRLSTYSIDDIFIRLLKYTKFLFVRHPIDRLVSAYQNKFVQDKRYTNQYRDTIKKRFPSESIIRNSRGRVQLSFAQFLELVAKDFDSGFHNNHWATFIDLCNPCQIKYDHVLKLETLDTHSNPFLEKLKQTNSSVQSLPKRNQARRGSASEKLQQLTNLFHDIDPSVMEELLDMYGPDLEMFGYQWDQEKHKATCETALVSDGCGTLSCC